MCMHALFCFKRYNATLWIAYNLLKVCDGGPILTVKRCIALKYMTCTSIYFVLVANLATWCPSECNYFMGGLGVFLDTVYTYKCSLAGLISPPPSLHLTILPPVLHSLFCCNARSFVVLHAGIILLVAGSLFYAITASIAGLYIIACTE